ncbi:hypothetical protein BSKO_00930 [Bryopsis sp. KO-2023]|nr:hypothetical protein BSKO_00930 [Bryopsis sp. KO-2023]
MCCGVKASDVNVANVVVRFCGFLGWFLDWKYLRDKEGFQSFAGKVYDARGQECSGGLGLLIQKKLVPANDAVMTTCVAGFSSQKLWVLLGLILLLSWLVPLVRAMVSFRVKGDEDEKYKKKRWIYDRQNVAYATRLIFCVALSVFFLRDPWILSWLDWSNTSSAGQSAELDCSVLTQMRRGEKVGQGFYASVTEAWLLDRKIAIKSPNPRDAMYLDGSRREFIRESFAKERRLFRRVKSSSNVVEFLGSCEDSLFLEFLPTPLETYVASQNVSLPFERVAELWMSIASALDSLHRAPGGTIVHTDIRPEQFLFNEQGVLKLGDLNRAHQIEEGLHGFCRSAMDGRYKSPEQISGSLITEKTDIYAMGLTFHYVLTRSEPFRREDPRGLGMAVLNGKRPEVPSSTPEFLKAILEATWHVKPKLRPTAGKVLAKLQNYRNQSNET